MKMDGLQSLNRKLERREKVFGFLSQLGNAELLPGYKREGVDFVLFDLEHGPFNLEQTAPLLRVCRLLDLPTIIRVQDAVYHLIAKSIDLGGDGILLPRTETPEQVRAAVDAVRFSPVGRKGCGGGGQFRKQESFEDFQKNRVILLQIESPLGVENLPRMLDLYKEQVAGVIIGPYDLSVQAGTPLTIDSPEVEGHIRRTIDICGKFEKSVGIFCGNAEEAARRRAEGMNVLWTGSDAGFLNLGLSRTLQAIAGL